MPTVLIVDDRADDRLVLRLHLEDYGFQIVEANCGDEALRLAQQHAPDLILMDLILAEAHGWDIARQIHAETPLRSIPIVATSAYSLTARTVGTLHPDQIFQDYLVKPITHDRLVHVLSRLNLLA